MRIAVISDFGYPAGIWTNITTEGRLPIQYAVLLANNGHDVDVITDGGVSDIDKPENINWCRNKNAILKTYDLCIGTQDRDFTRIKAKKYIIAIYTKVPSVELFTKHWEEKLQKPVICVKRDNDDGLDAHLWAYPIYTSPPSGANFEKKALLYVCKHNPSPAQPEEYAKFMRYMTALGRFKSEYHLKALFFSTGLGVFHEATGTGMNYNELLGNLPQYKLTLTYYYGAQSVTESVLSGCLPTLWKNPHWRKGTGPYADAENTTLFDIEDSEQEHFDKLYYLLSNREYYSSQWEIFMNKSICHLPENSYKQFLELIS